MRRLSFCNAGQESQNASKVDVQDSCEMGILSVLTIVWPDSSRLQLTNLAIQNLSTLQIHTHTHICIHMQDANERDLSQFERWYLQAGTPIVKATDSWDAETGTYSLTLEQTVPDTPGQTDKSPMQIPVRVP